jgi:hypothetical protein
MEDAVIRVEDLRTSFKVTKVLREMLIKCRYVRW